MSELVEVKIEEAESVDPDLFAEIGLAEVRLIDSDPSVAEPDKADS